MTQNIKISDSRIEHEHPPSKKDPTILQRLTNTGDVDE